MTNHGPMLNGQPMSTDKMAAEMEKQENVLLGILGAIGGALIGVVVMLLFYSLDMVSTYTGMIMAICAVKGYIILSKRVSVKGVVISAIVVLAMVYVGTRMCFALELTNIYKGYNIFEAFVEVDEKIARGGADWSEAFQTMLGQQYLYSGLGVVIMVLANVFGKKR